MRSEDAFAVLQEVKSERKKLDLTEWEMLLNLLEDGFSLPDIAEILSEPTEQLLSRFKSHQVLFTVLNKEIEQEASCGL
jgi:DNA-binding transcriptional MerR regulator